LIKFCADKGIQAEIAAEYGNDQGDVLSEFDDIARELVRIGDGVEGNHDFIQASHYRRTMTVTLWGEMEVGQGPLTPEWIADFRTRCWLRAVSGELRLASFGGS
jgi:hypothetical protein